MKNLIFLLCLFALFGCKSPEARYPVTHKSGSFIKESAERNKKLNEREQERIQSIMQQQPEIDFISSENGLLFPNNHYGWLLPIACYAIIFYVIIVRKKNKLD